MFDMSNGPEFRGKTQWCLNSLLTPSNCPKGVSRTLVLIFGVAHCLAVPALGASPLLTTAAESNSESNLNAKKPLSDTEIEKALQRGAALGEAGKIPEAEGIFLGILNSLDTTTDSNYWRGAAMLALADLHLRQGKKTDADILYKKASEVFASQKHQHAAAVYLSNIARMWSKRGNWAEAERQFRASNLILEGLSKKDAVAKSEIVARNGDKTEARDSRRRLEFAVNCEGLSRVLERQGRLDEAISEHRRALAEISGLGQASGFKARLQYGLAGQLMLQHKSKEAAEQYEDALNSLESTSNPDQILLAGVLDGLGTAMFVQRKLPRAEELSRRALRIYEVQLGPEHPETAVALSNLAFRLMGQEKYTEAIDTFNRALAIQDRLAKLPATNSSPGGSSDSRTIVDSFDSLAVMSGLAETYCIMARYASAESLFKRILAVKERRYGPEHPALISALVNLANCASLKDARESAGEVYLQRARRIAEKIPESARKKVDRMVDNEVLKELERSHKRLAQKEEF